jgi:hypothetical protein
MNAGHSEFDRTLRTWFEEGPTVMSDRVVEVVTARIALQPQRGRWRLQGRRFVNTNLKIAAGLAAALVVILVAWQFLPRDGEVGAQPTPGPTVIAAVPSAPPTVAPTAGRPWWLNATTGPCGEAPAVYGCAGELEAGSNSSGGFRPTMTYTVPEGWVNDRDWAEYFSIFPDNQINRAALSGGDDPSLAVVILHIRLRNVTCAGGGEVQATWSASEIAAALATRPGATLGSEVSIGGLPGWQVSVAEEVPWATSLCPEATPDPQDGRLPQHLTILDLPDGDHIVVQVRTTAAPNQPFLIAANGITETLEFDLGR